MLASFHVTVIKYLDQSHPGEQVILAHSSMLVCYCRGNCSSRSLKQAGSYSHKYEQRMSDGYLCSALFLYSCTVQWLRALTDFAEGLGSVLSIYILTPDLRGSDASDLLSHLHSHAHADIRIHMILKKNL